MNKREGFTLIELVVFTAIFAVTIISFISVLISITRTQIRQTAVSEVNQQSQFVLQAIQYYTERSSLIELDSGISTTTVKLRMQNSVEDPTLVFASGTQIYSQVGSDQPQALTTNKVTVSNFSLSKRSNAPGKDSLAVSFNISYNTQNPQQQFAQALQFAVARVNAVTFDSNLTPSTNNSLKIGATSQTWQSINDAIYFNGANVGIGSVPSSGAKFQVHSGDAYIDTASNGIVFQVSGGGCWRLYVTSGGTATTTSVSCPP